MTHKHGWKFCFVAGLMPFTIGLYGYITAFVMSTLLKPGAPFKVLWKTTSFSLDALAGFNLEAGVFFGILNLTFWQLLIMFGATLCAIAYFGLRAGQRWAWFYLLAAFVWAAGNDSLAAVYLYIKGVMVIPTPILVDLCGLTGLFLSRDVLRSTTPQPRHDARAAIITAP